MEHTISGHETLKRRRTQIVINKSKTPTKNDLNNGVNEFRMTQMKLQNAERKRSRIEENSPKNGEKNPKMYAQF